MDFEHILYVNKGSAERNDSLTFLVKKINKKFLGWFTAEFRKANKKIRFADKPGLFICFLLLLFFKTESNNSNVMVQGMNVSSSLFVTSSHFPQTLLKFTANAREWVFLLPLHHIISTPARGIIHYVLPFTQHLWQHCKERLVALQVHQELPEEKQTMAMGWFEYVPYVFLNHQPY